MVLTGKQEPACRQKLQQMRDTLKERAAYGNELGWKKKSHGQQNKKLKRNQNNPRTRAAGGESVQIPCSTLPKDVGSTAEIKAYLSVVIYFHQQWRVSR